MPHHNLHRHHARVASPDLISDAAAEAFAAARGDPFPEAEPQTSVLVVYVTASKTFDGPVGGYTTLGVEASSADTPAEATPTEAAVEPTSSEKPVVVAATPTPTPATTAQPKTTSKVATSIAVDTTSQPKSKSLSVVAGTTLRTSSVLPSSIVPTSSVATSLAIAVATTSLSKNPQSSTLSSTASLASATSAASSSSGGGMSSGGKAGLAIGLLLLFGTVIALICFFYKKRKDKAQAERLDDEKTELFGGAGRAASTRTTANAPRLSLRPITQFLPNLGGERRQSRGNGLAMAAAPAPPAKNGSGWERPMLSQETNRNNPFGNHAETIDATNANGPAIVNSVGPGGEIVAGAATGAVAAGAIGLARSISKRENQPKQIDFTRGGPFKAPPSPSGTEFSMSSESAGTKTQTSQGASIAAAGGPANSAVHRVQLDFKPSMEDELELRAGQLIRMLHEYDDGWALCIRLDRSQQGVCPRTCLSTRPVKPRPQQNGPRGPPPPGMRVPQQGPQGRPMSPAMRQGPPGGRPITPQGRPMTPQGRPMTPQGRPMTPTGPGPQKSMAPQSQGRPRSPSSAPMQGRRNSPPGPSPMNIVAQPEISEPSTLSSSPPSDSSIARKPVGQAL